MNFDERVELSAFDAETTHLNDFRTPPVEPYQKYRWHSEREEKDVIAPPARQVFTCPETLTRLRSTEYIPANFTWEPTPIIHPPRNYCDVKNLTDPLREEAIKMRPRVAKGGAVSIDNVEDPEIRNLLLKYMYITDFKRSMKDTQDYIRSKAKLNKPKTSSCADVPEMEIPCPITNEGVSKQLPVPNPQVNQDIKNNFEMWDRKQMRARVDPTYTFWMKHSEQRKTNNVQDPSSLISNETIDRLAHLIDTNRLRLPHDKPMGSYDGHLPNMTAVGFEKVEIPNKHPMKTTNETVYVNHYDHANNHYEK